MPLDFADKTNGELENLVRNHRVAGKTGSDYYVDALRALELRRGKGLDLQKSLQCVVAAAKERRFVAYKDIADVNCLEWSKIHWEIGDHLGSLCEYAHLKGLPLLSAIVVNAELLKSGEMKPESRAGFIAAARKLGFQVDDEVQFLFAQQEQVFKWAEGPAT